MNRKQRRALEKQTSGKIAQNFSDKISQFHMLPEQCTTCLEPFDKKNREMLATWNVVARQDVIRLFCPECVKKAEDIVKEYGGKDGGTETFGSVPEEDS